MISVRNLSLALLLTASVLTKAKSEEADAGKIFYLPPFVVDGQNLNAPQWIYYAGHSLEILSACSVDDTRNFIRVLQERRVELNQFIQAGFLLHTKLPTTIILYPGSLKGSMERDVFGMLRRIPKAKAGIDRFRPMSDLRLADPDSVYLFVFLNSGGSERHASLPSLYQNIQSEGGLDFVYSPSYLQFLLRMRTPALPEWFISGVTRFYDSMYFSWGKEGFRPDPWLSGKDSQPQRVYDSSPRPLLPVRELLVPRYPDTKSGEYQRVWNAEAELFVRWALSGQIPDGRDRLWRYAKMSSVQPATEGLFQDCFGLNFADTRDALSDYLPLATSDTVKGPPSSGQEPAKAPLSEASGAEIRRIEGEWARRSLGLVKRIYPAAVTVYAHEATRLLQGGYDAGDRDPRLVASLALLRIESDDTLGGRVLIETHSEACGARPLASLELAQFQLSDALEKPDGPNGKLSEAQSAGILGRVEATLRQGTPMESSYLLEIRALEHLGREPNAEELRLVDEGARQFPRNVPMLVKSASWMLRTGHTAEAQNLVELGLWENTDPVARGELRLLGSYAQPGH